MAPTNPTDRDLNWMLARVCGIKLNNMDTWWQLQHSTHGMEWNPLHDANQMEMIEEALRIKGCEMGSAWSKSDGHWTAHLLRDPNPNGDPDILYKTGMDLDKKRAFALAVCAWWNEQKKEKAT